MKKLMAVSFATLIATGVINVSAAEAKENKINFTDIIESVKENSIYEDLISEKDDCKVIFKILDILKECNPDINLPDINLPDISLPDIFFPDSENPEDNPESEKPETDKPETDKPETDKPETDEPETDEPETNLPETDTDIPVIPDEKPETDKPETDDDASGDVSESAYVNEVLRLVNSERASNGLPAVSLDNAISSAADIRAKEIKSSFSHTRPDGRSCFTVLSDEGISYNGAGENIAYGQSSPSEVMNAWMNSEGHRANILNSSFTKLGVGVYSSGGTLYWVQLFTY